MKKLLISLSFLLGIVACRSDFINPNAPTVDAVTGSAQGLQGLIVGTQSRFSVTAAGGLYASITGNGFATRELRVINAGNADILALEQGLGNVAPSNPVVTNLWTNLNLVRFNAEKLIDNAGVATDPGTSAGIRAYGHLFKALALGTMAQFWTHAVAQSTRNAPFITRQEALNQAVTLLDQASDLLAAPGSTIPTSFTNAVGANINLPNALRALSARYNLMLGNYAQAAARANAVDLTSRSTFAFDAVAQNPVFRSSFTTNNVYDVNANFGLLGALIPNSADGRIAFYLTNQANFGKGFFLADATPVPLYLPSEMTLIKAEVFARNNQLTEAVTELNKVITKTAASDPFGVGANLPAYDGTGKTQAEVLTEIYRNRCMELFMSGLRLDDSRRFERPGPTTDPTIRERNRNYYPFPLTERDNNPNTPADPAN
ncbi:MAG: RagB/SusD family nutrient uptake outer membrane protein [Microscillaceae bacterium]|nr:RagB/SusD family nutrient uptake outer membrane protein [Microscillaceae bacterium]